MSKQEQEELPPPSLGRVILNLLPLIIVTWYLCQSRPDQKPGYQLEQCGKNLHTIGVAIEKDRLLSEEKVYNSDLKSIFGKTAVPSCPVGGEESYFEGYKVAPDGKSYVLVCKGKNHTEASVPSDYPRIAFSVAEANGKAPATEEKPDEANSPESSASPAATESPAVEPAKMEESADVAQDQEVEEKNNAQEEANEQSEEESQQVEEGPTPGATPKSE